MTIRRSDLEALKSKKVRRKRRVRTNRGLKLEHLEDRRVMAALQLAGVLPNDGVLLREGDVRNVAPGELLFRFSDGAVIDPASLDAISLIRAGGDGTFESASVASDLNTNGAVVVEFSAMQPGQAGNGIVLAFDATNRGADPTPGITVDGRRISIQYNSNPSALSTAFDLRRAIESTPSASVLIRATITRGNAFTAIGNRQINYSPLVLNGANSASGSTNFGLGSQFQVLFTAVESGQGGNGLRVTFSKFNPGGAAAPVVSVSGRTINVALNSSVGNESTLQDVVAAVNAHNQAKLLIRAQLVSGTPTTKVGGLATPPPVVLVGANDFVITPGHIDVLAPGNQVVMRFQETLPDDRYLISVLGTVAEPLQTEDGTAFNDGQSDFRLGFELDLAPQIISVVPQPISRTASGALQQARDEIHVYFNDDDLDPVSAVRRDFYQLIFTNDTVRNTDDVIFLPVSVTYSSVQDRAILKFAAPLEQLGAGEGTFRLRIGTDEGSPLQPSVITPAQDPGSSFVTALALGASFDTGSALVVAGAGSEFVDGQFFTVIDRGGSQSRFEFENTVSGPAGVQAGSIAVGFAPSMTPIAVAQAIVAAINSAPIDVAATRTDNVISLAGDAEVHLDPTIRGMRESTRGLLINGSITNVGQSYGLDFPGGGVSEETGHREIFAQDHLTGAADSFDGITTAFYNFQDVYGFDPVGNALRNAITPVQMQRAREIFQIYSEYLGIQFIESANSGMTIVTGDMRAIAPGVVNAPGGVLALSDGDIANGLAIMDLQDYSGATDDVYGGRWFQAAMHQIGHLLGMGNADELPAPTIMSGQTFTAAPGSFEPIYPSDADIIHGQHLFRPESKDIDLYSFEVTETGLFTAESLAERLADPSQLDTTLLLFREVAGVRELIAQNDDYFSQDSFLELLLTPAVYYIGVSASGNDQYDPTIPDSGLGGVTQGAYQLRLNFRPEVDNSIVDVDNANNASAGPLSQATPLDGDGDGVPGGVYNHWFRAVSPANTIYVDLWSASNPSARRTGGAGTLGNPYSNIATALAAATPAPGNQLPGKVVRLVGNGGADGDIATLDDNLAYEVGFSALNATTPLLDGSTINVPRGVTLMVDAGVIIKSRRARIGVGSSSTLVDRSAGAVQVMGVPRLFDAAGNVRLDEFGAPLESQVILTSLHDTIGVDRNPDSSPPAARAGDWGGIAIRADLDKANSTRFDYERQGIFLNYINHADIRYGGGNIIVDGIPQIISPISMVDSRPTISFNTISLSADAALAANPDSSEETNFHSPPFQLSGAFTSDYARIGPDIYGNTLINNSLNGLFVRIATPAGTELEKLTVTGRWDDADVVVVLQENLKIQGTPGGLVLEDTPPGVTLVTLNFGALPGTLEPGTYNYRLANVDAAGNEGPPSSPTRSLTLGVNQTSIQLQNLEPAPVGFVGRRLYRSVNGGPYVLVTSLNASSPSYLDNGTTAGGALSESALELRPRLDASLRVDPGVIVKLEGALIEVEMGAQLIAEGVDGREVIFTSLRDTRYGAGGTFNTNNQAAGVDAQPGNWAGIFVWPQSGISLDHAVVAFGGGVTRVDGDFRSFNPLEIHQSEARIAHSVFEFNADGIRTGAEVDRTDSRFGRGFNDRGVLFVRGSQPVLVGNTFINNDGSNAPAISIDVSALNSDLVVDRGRSTGPIDLFPHDLGNRGPLIRGNMLYNNGINGMVVRGGVVTSEATMDDVDIVHVVLDEIIVPNYHTLGGMRLESSATESLVVKLRGADAGFTASGKQLDIIDRVGGSVMILGQPGFPVVLTSLTDDSAGAGFDPFGSPQTDTDNNALLGSATPQVPVGPEVNNGTLIDNDAFQTTPGFFSYRVGDGGNNTFGQGGGVTVQGNSGLFVNRDFIFDFLNFVDVGSNGNALNLGTQTTVTSPATLVSDDLVVSEGTFQGENGVITWRVESWFEDGVPTLFNRVSLSSDQPLGDLQFINYLDEDVFAVSDDLLYVTGTPGEADFRAFTLDDAERVGFSHGGIYQADGNLLSNATYIGWAADEYADLLTDIDVGAGKNYTIAGDIDTNDLLPFNDPELGQVFGLADITTAFAWRVNPGANFATMTSFLELIPRNPALLLGQPGDWRSVLLDPLSNDRNVAPINEREAADLVAPGSNGVPNNAQFLGQLAPNQKAGDDNLRLAFEVRGRLSSPADVDVYSFRARAGTDVIFDIDRTTMALDSVIELITADGEVLARSTNSEAETADPFLLFRNPAVPFDSVNPLPTKDVYSTNPRDAGMQIRLPGASNEENVYYLRVRANSGNLNNVAGGLTSGAYQLQIRLQGLDETIGSTVSYADIRFATNGVEVIGVPAKSPLAGEIAEVEDNGVRLQAQPIGNIVVSDLSAISIAGNLPVFNDVDFYQFEVTWADIATVPDPSPDTLVPITIDVDYADGLGRGNTVIWLFDSGGNLIGASHDSNIASDRPIPTDGTGLTDLSRGTVGPLDPFLGPIMLPQGQYSFAVTSNAMINEEFGQFRQSNPTNPLVRVEPNTAIGRIAEDHIAQPGFVMTAAPPQIPILLDATSPRPLFLGDAILYVSRDIGTYTSQIVTVNPFTGAQQFQIGQFNFDVGDIDFRDNEELRAFTMDLDLFPPDDAQTGNYLLISHENATVENQGDDGIQTFNLDPADPASAVRSNDVNGTRIGYGIHFDALTYGYFANTERGFAVGGRPAGNFSPGVAYTTNILYEFDPVTGIPYSAPANDRTGVGVASGAGTQIVERGFLNTSAGGGPGGNITGIQFVGTTMYAVSSAGGLFIVQNPTTPLGASAVYVNTATDLVGINFQGLAAGPVRLESGEFAQTLFGITGNGVLYAFNTAGELQPIFSNGRTSVPTGLTNVRGLTFSELAVNPWHIVDERRSEDPGHGINLLFDESREPTIMSEQARLGNSSYYFGRAITQDTDPRLGFAPIPPESTDDISLPDANYDFAGGAHGILESNPFSLVGYSPLDLPTLYFNYYLVTEGVDATGANPMRDAFRVFISDETGQWRLLGSNVEEPNVFTGEPLYDIGQNDAPDSWRQARVNLAQWAGQDNLRLRFDFTTTGTFLLGNLNFGGTELRTIAGSQLRDGQTFLVGNQTFEIEMGPTLVAAEGRDIVDGETFTIHGVRYEFNKVGGVVAGNTPIPIDDTQSASAVAEAIELAVSNVDHTYTGTLTGEDNDVIARAVDSGLRGGPNAYRANGVIGDNLLFALNPGLDVDMVRVDMRAGDRMEIDLAIPGGSSLAPHLRVFNAAGTQLASNDGNSLAFTAATAGSYYIGISGVPNGNYNPLVAGSGIAGATGAYSLEVVVNNYAGVLPRLHGGNRVQLDGAADVTQSVVAATVIDGSAGVASGNVAVVLHADMTAEEVAALAPGDRQLNGRERYVPLKAALANTFAGGSEIAIKTYKDLVLLIGPGQNLVNRGPFGASTFLPLDTEATLNSTFAVTGGVNDFGTGPDLNDFEGVYIDNIIIGFAEHGEFVTGAGGAIGNLDTFFAKDPREYVTQIVTGAYDVEVRRAVDYGELTPLGTVYFDTYDTNHRQESAVQLIAPPADQIVDGQVFAIGDGVRTVRFEFENVNVGDGVQPGHFPIAFNPQQSQPGGGVSPDSAVVMARRIRDAINSPQVQAVLKVKAALADGSQSTTSTSSIVNLFGNAQVARDLPVLVAGNLASESNDTVVTANRPPVGSGQSAIVTASGAIGDNPALVGLQAALDVDLMALSLISGSTMRIDVDADLLGSPLNAVLRVFDVSGNQLAISDNFPAPGEQFTNDPYIEFTAPNTGTYYIGVSSVGNTSYNIFDFASGIVGSTTGFYELTVEIEGSGIDFIQLDGFEDRNRDRPQGQVVIENSVITRSLQFGVVVDAGAREADSGEASPGSVRNLREVNTNALLPGAVVQNNVITFNNQGGIHVSGQANAAGEPRASSPFARVLNNTIVGRGGTLNTTISGGSDVGIRVDQNASPTLLNNIVANFENGIQVDATSQTTVMGGMLFQGNDFNSNFGLGNFPIVLSNSDPLFLDLASENFYPAPFSQTVDSSINSLEDRLAMITIKQPLGIASSPILAPEYDSIGQLRADDPDVEPPAGFGSNVFIDRGAIDRADFAGPTAVLIDPRDNDAAGLDLDDALTIVELASATLFGFSIQLVDGVEPIDPQNGVGVNDATVTKDQVTLLQDDRILIEGIDYRFRYDALNNLIRLTPLAGIWPTNHIYTIVLANRDQFVIRASNGSSVPDGQSFTITDLHGNQATFEFESGYSLRIIETLSLQIPSAGGGLNGLTDRETIVVTRGAQTATLEFDNNGSVAGGNIPVVFTPTSTRDSIAAALVTALINANIGLSPKTLSNGRVHVGSTAAHVVDISGAPSLTRSGFEGGGVADGDLLRVDDGTKVVIYEFDNNGSVATGNTTFTYANSDTYLELATRLRNRLDTDIVGLNPVNFGDGFLHIGGTRIHQIDASQSQLILTGQPGVEPGFGIRIPTVAGRPVGIDDGDTFILGNGIGLPVTFEFDNNGSFVPGNTVISFNATTTLNQLANAIASAIASVNIGLNPTNTGNGEIALGIATPLHFFNPGTSSLLQMGQPGVPGSIAVPYSPDESFTEEDLARAIRDAINSSELQGVTAIARGGEIVLDGAANVTGIADAFVTGIRDKADNLLKANQTNGTTTFTIILGSGMDFGDAPDSYGTLSESGGPSHVVDSEFHLGADIDVDVNGQPSVGADGDDLTGRNDEDGVTFDSFRGGYDTTFTITVNGVTGTRPGFLSAWIDFNRNGVFDASEQVLADVSVVNGANVFDIAVPPNVSIGLSYARFRLSSDVGLSPGGPATNGEVEDYAINLQVSAWRNPVNHLDVEPDGALTPFDVLRIVSLLQREGLPVFLPKEPPLVIGGSVITAPPYVDPNGDGVVDLRDAQIVVAALFLQAHGGGGEGEGEGEFDGFGDFHEPPALVGNFDDDGEGEGGFTRFVAAPAVEFSTQSESASSEQGTSRLDPSSKDRKVQEVAFRLSQAGQRVSSHASFARSQRLEELLLDLTADFADEAHDQIFANI